MNMLLARFSLMVVMITAIAGASLVQGSNAASASTDAFACNQSPTTRAAADTLQPTPQRVSRTGQRAVRWQSLLPGTFR